MAVPVLVTLIVALLPAMQPAPTPPLPHAILANGGPTMPDTLSGRWIVTEVAEAAIPPGAPVTLEFAAEGGLSGMSGCNSYGASLEVNGNELIPGAAQSTKMACDTPVMALEAAFMRALDRLTRYEIAADGTLALYGFETLLMRARRE